MAVGWAVNYSLMCLRCVSAAFCVCVKHFIQTLTFNSVNLSHSSLQLGSESRPLARVYLFGGGKNCVALSVFKKNGAGGSLYKLYCFGFRANQRQEAAEHGGDAVSRRAQNAHAHKTHTLTHAERENFFLGCPQSVAQ